MYQKWFQTFKDTAKTLWVERGDDVMLSHDKVVCEPGSERVVLCTALMGFELR